MKKLRKAFAVILSLAMVLGMSLTTFAADYPSEKDSSEATVGGLQPGDTVAFHQIVKPHYDGQVFTDYEIADSSYVIDKFNQPTAEEITTIAGQVRGKTPYKTATVAAGADSVTENLTVGTYLVLVTPATGSDIVYNPMIVSVYYTVDGIETNPVSAADDFEVGSTSAYAKRSGVRIDKTITNDGSGTDGKGDDTSLEDRIEFQIVTDVPKYSAEYTNITYKITDTLKGLEDVQNVKVYLDSTTSTALTAGTDYTYTAKENGYEIDLSTYVKNNLVSNNNSTTAQHQFYVTYDAKLSADAGVNFDYNKNTAELEYSNTPTTTTTKDSTTYHYTFAIDANLNGVGSYKTGELFKTGEGEEGFREDTETIEVKNPLEGAVFEITKTDENYNAGNGAWHQEQTSTADGRLNFTGLDAGYYTFKETKAPMGYSLNNEVHKVQITANYNSDGTLSDYTILIDGKATSTYTAEYEKEDSGKIIAVRPAPADGNEATTIKNTTLANLPSTGGIGTTIFTIGGCIIMVAAAGLFFASRRKSSK